VTGGIIAAAPVLTVALTILVLDGATLPAPVVGVLVLWPLAVVELAGTTNDAAAVLPTVAASAERVVAVLDTPDPVPDASDRAPLPVEVPIVIDARDLTARWPGADRDAVGPVSFHLPTGGHHAIVGPSGSGKSTLAAVLVDFLAPHGGVYLVAGRDAATVAGLRTQVTWLTQLPWLADSTVRENLRLAAPTANDETLLDAVAAVRLREWFDRLPAGLDTHIGRGASAMSGGEAQRLALARVLLAGHRVLVLDEPTAHLDRSTADAVMSTLLERCADRTTLVLGHHAT
jgi:ATP-binding cassette subfamily C protein CydCD